MSPEDFAYDLPNELIAQHPLDDRGATRLLELADSGAVRHRRVADLPDVVPADALVVVNDSRVVPARVQARREDGREFELLLCEPGRQDLTFLAWVRGAKRLRTGDVLRFDDVVARYLEADETDPRARRFERISGDTLAAARRVGEVPLPPYVRRADGPTPDDVVRYQTVYATHEGSVAAPTAGLHFTDALLAGLDHVPITLHVGPGTFLPMEADDVADHRVGRERYDISEAAAARISEAMRDGRPIVAVGTTVTRTLETLATPEGLEPGSGSTDLVIRPGHRFQVVRRLLTNFHLPRSSLLMLTCAFGGRERVLAAYREAVAARYRFYSFGDAMWLTPQEGSP